MKIFLETNQLFIFCCLQRKAFSIYLSYFTNDAGKQLRNCLSYMTDKTKSGYVRDKRNFRAGCIEQIHCGYVFKGQTS